MSGFKTGGVYYLNFMNDNFVNKYMVEGNKYDEEISVPVGLMKEADGFAYVRFFNDINVGWTGNYDDHHIDHIMADEIWAVSPTCISDEPKGVCKQQREAILYNKYGLGEFDDMDDSVENEDSFDFQ